MTKQCAFDALTRFGYGAVPALSPLAAAVPFIAAVATSILSCFASQPGDVLLTRAFENAEHKSSVVGVLRERGLRGFFVGTKARLLHVGFIITIQLVM